MTSADAIAMLDKALAENGQDCTLIRWSGTVPDETHEDVAVRAFVRGYQPSEIAGGIIQSDLRVIMSPSEIAAAGWPVGEAASETVADPSLPRKDDQFIAAGRTRTVVAAAPFYVGADLVRIELQVRG